MLLHHHLLVVVVVVVVAVAVIAAITLPQCATTMTRAGMILTGRRVKAQEGFELGFVTHVVSGGANEVVAAAVSQLSMGLSTSS